MFKKILVALDLSSISQEVFKQALSIAKAMDARLMLLHILSGEEQGVPSLEGMASVGYYYGSLRLETLKYYQERWQTYIDYSLEQLKSFVEAASEVGVIAEFTQTPGRPSRAICDQAQNWNADLILVGRRGYSGLSELLLGSVSSYVTHHAACSVLVVQLTSHQDQKIQAEKVEALASSPSSST
ncbi:MAG: universal stress protein [Microcoleaceae cyanobacterium]